MKSSPTADSRKILNSLLNVRFDLGRIQNDLETILKESSENMGGLRAFVSDFKIKYNSYLAIVQTYESALAEKNQITQRSECHRE